MFSFPTISFDISKLVMAPWLTVLNGYEMRLVSRRAKFIHNFQDLTVDIVFTINTIISNYENN